MVETELAKYFKTAEVPRPRDLRPFKRAVERGLHLEDGLGDRVDYSVIDDMTEEIAAASFHASDFLRNKGVPNFGLIYPWGGEQPRVKNKGMVVLADADVNFDNPNGLIRFSPKYLDAIANFKMGIDDSVVLSYGHDSSLDKITAHEEYHIYQYFCFPITMERHVQAASSKDLAEWNKTWAEKGARRFETVYDASGLI